MISHTGHDIERARRLVTAALDITARWGWDAVRMADVAAEAGLSLADAYAEVPEPAAILPLLDRIVDTDVLAQGAVRNADDSARDRLFELLMRRFDAMRRYRNGLRSLRTDRWRWPGFALAGAVQARQSMAWMLHAAGLDPDGPDGVLRTIGLGTVYLAALRVWLDDETEDLATTMAELDRRLRQAETVASWCGWSGRPRSAVPAGPAPATGTAATGATATDAAATDAEATNAGASDTAGGTATASAAPGAGG